MNLQKKPVIDVGTIDAIDNKDREKLRPSMVGIFLQELKDKIKNY